MVNLRGIGRRSMPTFVYKARKGPHELVEGKLDSPDKSRAIRALDGLGLVPISIYSEQELPGKTAQRPLSTRGVRKQYVNNFIRSLANLVKGNVPILKALNLLEKQFPAGMKEIVSDLANAVRQGASLSQAMERYPNVFPRFLIGMVRSGESAGLLGEMLEKTADNEERSEDMRRKIRGAMAYPLFVLGLGFVTIFVLLAYFMPRLMEAFYSNQQKLPWPTEMTLSIGRLLSENWYWILGLVVLLFAFAHRRGKTHGLWDPIMLKFPFIRSLVLKSSIASFSRTLGLLVAHGVPVAKGVSLAAETVSNRVMKDRLKAVEDKLVKRGFSLGNALREVPDFPPMTVMMVAVGEESGNIATTLNHVAGQYEKEVETWLRTSTTLIEPVMILLVGGIIGFIVFSMLMPIFQMDVLME